MMKRTKLLLKVVLISREFLTLNVLELFYCKENFFEGVFMVFTTGEKWRDFLELIPTAERITFLVEATEQKKRNLCSPVNFRRVYCFKTCCSIQLMENSEKGVNSTENFAAVVDLSQRNMLIPITEIWRSLDFNHEVFQNYPDVLYSS